VLRASGSVLKPGGSIAFFTIQPRPDLDQRRRRRANRAGPPAVAVPTSYESLLKSAGFGEIESEDVTREYRTTQRRWIDAMSRYEVSLRAEMGDEMFDERAQKRAETLAAIDAGLLSRFIYVATRPR
jgi:hypothetical protein